MKKIAAALAALMLSAGSWAALPALASDAENIAAQDSVRSVVEQSQRVKVKDEAYSIKMVGITFPVVTLENQKAADKINKTIEKDMQALLKMVMDYTIVGTVPTVGVTYEETYQSDEYWSVRLHQYYYADRAAHPTSYDYGYVFRLSDGKRLDLKDLAKEPRFKNRASRYTLPAMEQAVKLQTAEHEIPLYDFYTGLKEAPKEFYLDSFGNVHILFQQYEIAPYSSGIIDINLDE